MKKKVLIALGLAGAMIFSLAACGGSANDAADAADDAAAVVESAQDTLESAADAAETAADTLESASDVLESAGDALETAADAAGASGEIAKGDTGDGPAVLASKYADFTIPEGVTYEVYDYVVTDSTGSVIIDFGTTNTRQARIEISTTRMVSDLESAAGECERMHAGEYTSNTAERGATVTFGGQEYQIIYVTGDYADEIYLVTYLVNEEGRDTYVEVKLDQDPFGAEGMSTDDPALAEVLNAVAFH